MPRRLPRYDLQFGAEARRALDYVARVETARSLLSARHTPHIRGYDVEISYELAFIRIFLAWETLLEDCFVRLLCGYAHSLGQEPLIAGANYERNTSSAERKLLGTRSYVLWHNPEVAIKRCRAFFSGSRYELVIRSGQTSIEKYAAVRHRIVHAQEHARHEFDAATMSLVGRRYAASRPGRFLRDWDRGSSTPTRWIEKISDELEGFAYQICV